MLVKFVKNDIKKSGKILHFFYIAVRKIWWLDIILSKKNNLINFIKTLDIGRKICYTR